jgi:acetyl/propionyl-CoA carboxylase alpha subunit
MRILVANRGEIARRVMRSARRLGHQSVAVYAEPDATAPFVAEATSAYRLGPAELAASYLSIERVLAALTATGADAVHPGYGFLAENAAFARAVQAAGATWIGPHPEAIEAMGSKIEARRLAAAAGVPVIPGFDQSQEPAALAEAAQRIGFPVLIKAAAGGGGKGIRIVHEGGAFAAALREASSEGERSFGSGAVIVERYVQRPRHVEVQVMGDRHGTVIHLGTRECSVQRRYQKLLEEAPAPNLADATRAGLEAAAVDLARSIGYDSAGTMEFIVDDETGDYFFLEMNTRLQVEHPVTECVTGLDLVELQIRSAQGEPLPLAQGDVTFTGHAFEARVNAEDPAQGFTPQIGTVTHLVVPAGDGVRWDAAIEHGSVITPFYDSMVAKLIVHGPDRPSARRRLGAALDQLVLGGLVSNTGFQRWLVDQAPVVEGRVTTRFLDETPVPAGRLPPLAEAALAWHTAVVGARRGGAPWQAMGPFRVTPHRPREVVALRCADGEVHEVVLDSTARGGASWAGDHLELAADGLTRRVPASVDLDRASVAVAVDGHTHTFAVVGRSERWAPAAGAAHGSATAVVAPFPAAVTEVLVTPGQAVDGGEAVVVIEAMKMLHTLSAAGPGVVAEVRVAPGDQVKSDQILVTFEATEPSEGPPIGGPTRPYRPDNTVG